jgi:hypothetical protein
MEAKTVQQLLSDLSDFTLFDISLRLWKEGDNAEF